MTKAGLAIHGIPLHHWKCGDISKLLARSSHLIDISEETCMKSRMDCARVLVGCESLAAIPRQFTVIVREQLYAIRIEVKCSWGMPRETVPSVVKEGMEVLTVTPVSVGEVGTSEVGLVCSTDRSCIGVVLHLAWSRRSYIWKRVECNISPIDQNSTCFKPVGVIFEN